MVVEHSEQVEVAVVTMEFLHSNGEARILGVKGQIEGPVGSKVEWLP